MGKEEEEVKRENALNRRIPVKIIKNLRDPRPAAAARNYVLLVTIYEAEGLDPPSLWPEVRFRNYRTLLWVNSVDQYMTNETGLPLSELGGYQGAVSVRSGAIVGRGGGGESEGAIARCAEDKTEPESWTDQTGWREKCGSRPYYDCYETDSGE
ncbi:hypothetical protein GQ457_08G010770 [Hibiscus cannabinus]